MSGRTLCLERDIFVSTGGDLYWLVREVHNGDTGSDTT
jgi:hypothetical protein